VKRILACTLAIAAALGAGVGIGFMWGTSRKDFQAEAVIGREVEMLEKTKGTPSCDERRERRLDQGESTVGTYRVLWRVLPAKKRIARLVVSSELDFAFEEVEDTCNAQ
jgi:hypothetical protein